MAKQDAGNKNPGTGRGAAKGSATKKVTEGNSQQYSESMAKVPKNKSAG